MMACMPCILPCTELPSKVKDATLSTVFGRQRSPGTKLATVFAIVSLVAIALFAGYYISSPDPKKLLHVTEPLPPWQALGLKFFHEPENEVMSGKVSQAGQGTAAIPHRESLNNNIVNAVKKLVFFVGHERSCHSFVGSLIDAHPHMVLATSYSPLQEHYSNPSSFPSKSTFFNKLSKVAQAHGVRYTALDKKGYSLVVDDKYQGVFENHLDVIGSQRAAPVSKLYSDHPDAFVKLMRHIREVVGIPIHMIRVIRNPYDLIATAAGYAALGAGNFTKLKISLAANNITTKLEAPEELKRLTLKYFNFLQSSEGVIATVDESQNVYCDQLIGNPEKVIRKLCDFLQVECYADYVNNAVSKVFKSQSATRKAVHWPEDILEYIDKESSKYPFLGSYIKTGVE